MSQEMLEAAVSAVRIGQFEEGIHVLECIASEVRPPDKLYYSANIWLVRAYKESGQLPAAIRLCRQLATSSHPKVQVWAQQALPILRQPAKGARRLGSF
ncbi:hypothetical protein IQ260_01600 [Leptolyngbya cf. ectocarpi LEGE 11479]|uniref:Tetratricopeptide repeat protein n=1 Tax=Leptolyngbya cf. ectocarpi LEGE 11479 TaxID=1828722 RepID=A0A928X0V5_LEPEC|nr:hypothetical protein [Leptolyngbya ectocarpi]MBE9065341.1 hypothetical protein [Leptolyngbya cf. ectocarpi LEGE 11479]